MSNFSRLHQIRRSNLEKAFIESRLRTHQEFAAKLGIHKTRLSQLINGKVSITDNQAREIEHTLHLKRHWLDSRVIRFYVQVSTEKLEEAEIVGNTLEEQGVSRGAVEPEGESPIITALRLLNEKWDGDIKPVKKLEWILGKYDLLLTVELLDIDDIHTFISMLHHSGKVKRTETILTIKSTERFD